MVWMADILGGNHLLVLGESTDGRRLFCLGHCRVPSAGTMPGIQSVPNDCLFWSEKEPVMRVFLCGFTSISLSSLDSSA